MNKKRGAKTTTESANSPKNYFYVNLRKECRPILQEMLDEQGHELDIRDVSDLVRAILNTVLLKYQESRDFRKSVEETFLDLSPTGRHYDALRGIFTRNLELFLTELQEEQKKRIKK